MTVAYTICNTNGSDTSDPHRRVRIDVRRVNNGKYIICADGIPIAPICDTKEDAYELIHQWWDDPVWDLRRATRRVA